mmetsp:Transcript_109/g.213  ORF Transcript_109/g.213 Transcript_109/m.213 type:complete len:85 (-) Transcript_109:89-343(-)
MTGCRIPRVCCDLCCHLQKTCAIIGAISVMRHTARMPDTWEAVNVCTKGFQLQRLQVGLKGQSPLELKANACKKHNRGTNEGHY